MLEWAPELSPDYWPALIDLARRRVALRPDDPVAQLQLGDILVKSGAPGAAAMMLSEAAARLPQERAIHFARARAYRLLHRFDEALHAVAAARAAGWRDPGMDVLEFDLLLQMREWERAEQLLDVVAAIAPTHSGVVLVHLERARRTGQYADLLEACDAVLARDPGHTRALFCRAVALAVLGRNADARASMAIDRFTRIEDVPTPGGYESAEAFRSALTVEILQNPMLALDPTNKAMEGSLQSRALVQVGDRALPLLLGQITDAIDRYVSRLSGNHPFVIGQPKAVRLFSWSIVCDRDALLRPHIHSSGWLSGVTYVAAPQIAGTYQGVLVLGLLDSRLDPVTTPPWPTREIEPVPGRVVIFPSFVPHMTRSTGVDGRRISVSFDVEPE